MGADVSIGSESFNYTHNVCRLWYDHIPDTGKGGGLREIEGLTGRQAFNIMSAAMDQISNSVLRDWKNNVVGEPNFCARYDSSNGWGSTVGGILFLARIMAACARNPRHKVRVSL